MADATPDAPQTPDAPDVKPPKPRSEALADLRSEPTEVPILDVNVSLWMGWKTFAWASLIGIAGLTVLIIGLTQNASPISQALVIVGGAAFGAIALLIPYLILSIKALRYKITSRLIERERGLWVKNVDSLDLGRVKDVRLTQNVVQRVLGIGTIHVLSSDQSDPVMTLEAIKNPRPAYEQLRDAVMQVTHSRGVIPMDR
ncbi:MAG: PH domain-containing protein [Planctomycetes bacterium]|nr:PH domain-containing protein [Planctomycetota bacterium]